MDIYIPTSQKELSQKKLQEYANFEKVIQYGRQNPIWFSEYMFGIKLLDFQKYTFMNCWTKPFCLLLHCRGAGKTVEAGIIHMTKMLLIPNWKIFVAANSLSQSIECFKKIEDIALNRVPSFKSLTDMFIEEVAKSPNNDTGFSHDPKGHWFRLYNNSELVTLSSNIKTIRGKRGAVHMDETGWFTDEQYSVLESFINVDTSFGLGTEKVRHIDPIQMPLQLLYTSSASDAESAYFEKFKTFSKKMFLGDKNYFVANLDATAITQHSTVDGVPVKAHLTQAQIDKAVDEDPELAERELFNHFRRGGGNNAVVKTETLIRNSENRLPLLHNDTGKKKFIFCYDPARNFDNSVLSIFQLIDDENVGYKLQLENVITMVDNMTTSKTPLPMPQQLEIIKEQMIRYNGERAAEWENIELWIDAGAGGGGISAVADNLMEDWVDKYGVKHRGVIDPQHKQYATARKKYVHAVPIVRLVDPQGYKKIIYGELQKMAMLDLIKFTNYDNKDFVLLENKKGELESHELSQTEKIALVNIELMKSEVSYMCRYDTANGGVQYELTREMRNKMHDDRAYTLALAAYALSEKRRKDLTVVEKNYDADFFFVRQPKQYK